MNNDRIYYSNEAENYAMRERIMLATLFLTFGLGIGTTLALLFAPSSGEVSRYNIGKSFEKNLNNGREAIKPIKQLIENEIDELKNNIL